MRLSGTMTLVVFESVEILEFVKANQWDILDSCFMHKQWWSDKIKDEFVSVDEGTLQPSSFMKANIQIITNCSYRIDEIIQLQVGNERGDKEDGTKEVDRILQAVKDLVLSVGANEGKVVAAIYAPYCSEENSEIWVDTEDLMSNGDGVHK
ncbi:hypothetical protein Goklo_002964 [Gossypium klotzschianum]|uniref:Uncharacterized protein n=1 Tax=Gossypium klotzschianum TaxID=34286 RepID=A0A7J8VUT6_9ROSI|nr:hypothetical protein [Gossypium klotzschianum]